MGCGDSEGLHREGNWRHGRDSNPRIKVLQTSALDHLATVPVEKELRKKKESGRFGNGKFMDSLPSPAFRLSRNAGGTIQGTRGLLCGEFCKDFPDVAEVCVNLGLQDK